MQQKTTKKALIYLGDNAVNEQWKIRDYLLQNISNVTQVKSASPISNIDWPVRQILALTLTTVLQLTIMKKKQLS